MPGLVEVQALAEMIDPVVTVVFLSSEEEPPDLPGRTSSFPAQLQPPIVGLGEMLEPIHLVRYLQAVAVALP